MQKKTLNFRLILVCIAAASVGLPIAIISIAKVLLLTAGIALLVLHRGSEEADALSKKTVWTQIAIGLALATFCLSLIWTSAPLNEALGSLSKYGKLLLIPLIFALIKDRREALYALGIFALFQLFLVISSWMLFLSFPVPWATAPSNARIGNAVFSSYLDQGIMAAILAGLSWHFRSLVPGVYGRSIAISVAVIALLNVFFVLIGRSGHVVAIALISLAIMWELPKRYRLAILVVPLILVISISLVSPKVRDRISDVKSELQGFTFTEGTSVVSGTSSGIRLHFWHRAIQSMAERPILGSGVGSWSSEFNRLEKKNSLTPNAIEPMGNPHQEYLLWGVQLGLTGILLLLAFLVSVFHDTLKMDVMTARAVQSVLAALTIACLFNSIIYDALIGDFFCVTLGLLLALGSHRVEKLQSDEKLIAA